MNHESNIESKQEHLPQVESQVEEKESNYELAEEMLESPPEGDFRLGLEKFFRWIKDPFAKHS